MFYPGRRTDLEIGVRALLDEAPALRDVPTPKALIVPHAGYVYSGAIAARAYARLRAASGTVRRVVLIGPAHRALVDGLAGPDADAFETPLGMVPVDHEALRRVTALPRVREDAAAHAREHALEVQLPFLQAMLDDFSIVPLLAGEASSADVAAALDALWGGDETLVVVSSDLSHYHRYDAARAIDASTVHAIVDGRRELDSDEACGATPINGLMRCVRERGLVPRTARPSQLRRHRRRPRARGRLRGVRVRMTTDDHPAAGGTCSTTAACSATCARATAGCTKASAAPCFVRQRVGDAMVLTTYGRSSGFCIDPIEKKPLNHFYPGSSMLSFGTAGCNLACKFCQNWDISKSRDMDRLADAGDARGDRERRARARLQSASRSLTTIR